MDEIYRETLKGCYSYLLENVYFENLTDLLLQHGVLPKSTIEDINSLSKRQEQTQKLLDCISRRNNEAFESFMMCLEDSDQKHIADKLRDRLFELAPTIYKDTNMNNGFVPIEGIHPSWLRNSFKLMMLSSAYVSWPGFSASDPPKFR